MGYRNHNKSQRQFGPKQFGPEFGFGPGRVAGQSGAAGPGQPQFSQRRSGPAGWESFGPEFGFGGRGRGGRGRGRGPRVRRGDVRAAILDVLHTSGEDLNGYAVIQAIADKTDGAWQPSPGSVYPTISQLEDEGLVETVKEGTRKVLKLTEAGSAYVAEHPDELAAVWTAFEESGDDLAEVKHNLKQFMGAFGQVMSLGSPEQRVEAAKILADSRKKLYALLAED